MRPDVQPLRAVIVNVVRCAFALAVGALLSCASTSHQQNCNNSEWPASASLVKRTTVVEARDQFLRESTSDLPPDLQKEQAQWFDEEWARVFATLRQGDELWYFAEEKGTGSGWWLKGYIAFRGCQVVGRLITSEDN